MVTRFWGVLVVGLALVVGTATLAAALGRDRSGQDRPGQPTKAQVWIENRGRSEAVPVVVQDPVPVVVQDISTTAPMTVQPAGPIAVRIARQAWEYQTISVPRDADPRDLTAALAAPGLAGWEPAGVQVISGQNTLLVMKRPRQDEPRR